MAALTNAAVSEALTHLPGWALHHGTLVREWTMNEFQQAISFVNQVAEVAEAAGHHPDIDIRYTQVRLILISHDVGSLTRRDFDLARALSLAFPA